MIRLRMSRDEESIRKAGIRTMDRSRTGIIREVRLTEAGTGRAATIRIWMRITAV